MKTKYRILSFFLVFALFFSCITVTPITGMAETSTSLPTLTINGSDVTYQMIYKVGLAYEDLKDVIFENLSDSERNKIHCYCADDGTVQSGWQPTLWIYDGSFISVKIYGDDNSSAYFSPDGNTRGYSFYNNGNLFFKGNNFSTSGTISLSASSVPWQLDDTLREGVKKVANLSSFGTRKVSLNSLFQGCTGLTSVTSLPSGTVSMHGTFDGCTSLDNLPSFSSLTGLTSLDYAFNECEKLSTIPSLTNCTKVTTLKYAFAGTAITTPPDVSRMTSLKYIDYAFDGCKNLKTGLDLSNNNSLITATGAYQNCTALTSSPDITGKSSLTKINEMFKGCTSLSSIPSFANCNKLNDISYLFYRCTSLTGGFTLELGSCASLKNISHLFDGCEGMTTPPDISCLSNATALTNYDYLFANCVKLSGTLKLTIPSDSSAASDVFYYTGIALSGLTVDYTCSDSVIEEMISQSYITRATKGKNINTYAEIRILSKSIPEFAHYGSSISSLFVPVAVDYYGKEIPGKPSLSPDFVVSLEDQTTTFTFQPDDSKYISATKEFTYKASETNIDNQYDADPSVDSSYEYGTALKDIEITPGTFLIYDWYYMLTKHEGEWKFKNENTIQDVGTKKQTVYYEPSNPSHVTTKTFEVDVTIGKKQLSEDMLTLESSSEVYTGSEIKPNITMKNGSLDMTEGTDYTIAYSNNVQVGTATMTITGTGRYYGTITKDFNITETDMSAEISIEDKIFTYDASAHHLTVNIPDNATVLFGTSEGSYNLTEIPEYIKAGVYQIYWKVTKPNHKTVTGSSTLTIRKKPVTSIVFPSAVSITYGNTLGSSTLYGGSTELGNFTWKDSTIKPTVNNDGYDVVFTASDIENYDYSNIENFNSTKNTLTKTISLYVEKAECSLPTIQASGLVDGTSLSQSVIKADTSIGTYAWENPNQNVEYTTSQYEVRFTPKDIANYKWNTLEGWQEEGYIIIPCDLTVVKEPSISMLTYGESLSNASITNNGASVSGSFRWENPSSVLSAGTHEQTLTYTPDASTFKPLSIQVQVSVKKATPLILTNPSSGEITYGDKLSKSLLFSGVCNIPGTFEWASPDEILSAGTSTQSVKFTPDNTDNYEIIYTNIPVKVNKATPIIEKTPSAESSVYGTSLEEIVIKGGTASVAGEFEWVNKSEIPEVGTKSYEIKFVPDSQNYNTITTSIPVTIKKATPTITKNPTYEELVYGQSLGSLSLLGGIASVPGTFQWKNGDKKPLAGTSTEEITFVPTDLTHYTTKDLETSVVINKATPLISFVPVSTNISYGSKVGSSLLSSGTASVEGTFSWENENEILNAGTYTKTVIFTPTDSSNYKKVTCQVSLTVEKVTPTIDSIPTTETVTYGKKLSSISLEGGATSVAGAFSWDTPNEIAEVGTNSYSATFTPTDITNYSTVTIDIPVSVDKATPTILQLPSYDTLVYGQALETLSLSGGKASVEGTFQWEFPKTVPETGRLEETLLFVPTDINHYEIVRKTVTIETTKNKPIILTFPQASSIIYGDKVSVSELSGGSASVSGTFSWENGTDVLDAGTYARTVVFTPDDTKNYEPTTTSVTLVVNQATPVISEKPTASVGSYGTSLYAVSLKGGSANIEGEFSWISTDTVPEVGTTNYEVVFTPKDTKNYKTVTCDIPVTIVKATPNVLTYPTAGTITYGDPLSASVLVDGASNIPGRFIWENADEILNAGTHSRRVIFIPENTDNYERIGIDVSVTVNKATPKINKAPEVNSSYPYGKKLNEIPFVDGEANVDGTFTWQDDSAVPEVGTKTYTVTFTPDDTLNYNKTTTQVSVTIDKSVPTITTKPTVAGTLTYGQALSELTLSGGTAKNKNSTSSPTIEGVFSWANGTSVLSAGTHDVKVIFTPTDTSHYTTTETTVTVTVKKATPVISVNPVCTTISYGQKVSQSTLSGGTASVAGAFAWQDGSEVLNAGVHSKTVVFTPTDTNNYNTTTCSISLVVDKVTPKVTTFPTTKETTYGKTLSAISLDGGTASVEGTFAWNTPNEIPNVGTSSYSVTFTPTDNTNYLPVVIQVPVTIKKATPTISQMPTFGTLTYGQILNSLALTDGTASVDGVFQWKNGTKVPETGTSEETIIFTPTDTSHYETVEKTVSVKTVKNTPIILTFPQAAPIIYGSKVSDSTLSGGKANVEGTFEWQNGNETLDAGSYAKTVVFTPIDTKNYEIITTDITLLVNQATPVIVAPTAPTKAYGVRLNEIPLEGGSSNVAGAFSWNTIDTIPDVGTTDYEAVFTPTDTKNYKSVTCSVSVNIKKATPVITKTPSFENLVYGKSLGTLSLTNGTASVEGTFSWEDTTKSPETGSSEEVILFIPNDTDHYEIVRKTVTVKTIKNTPTIVSLPQASEITYGDTVSQSTLSDGSASTEGEFTWKNETDVLDAGTYTREITFTPNDTKNYETITANVSLKVNQATPVIEQIPTAETKPYGASLQDIALQNGSADVNGTFAWSEGSTVPDVGTKEYEVIFTPTDTKNYKKVTCNVSVTIIKATSTITKTPSFEKLVYGNELGTLILSDGNASVAGTFSWDNAKKIPETGTSEETIIFTPNDTDRYEIVKKTVNVTTIKNTPIILTFPQADAIVYGNKVADSTLTGGSATVEGKFTWQDGEDVLEVGSYARAVVFTPNDTKNYETVTTNITLTVNQATPVISEKPTTETKSYGVRLHTMLLKNGSANVNGKFSWRSTDTVPEVGTTNYEVLFTPEDTKNYKTVTCNIPVTIVKATPEITTKPSYTDLVYGQALESLTLTNGIASVAGAFQWKDGKKKLPVGTSNETVRFIPSDTGRYEVVEYETSVVTRKAASVVSVVPTVTSITYGECVSSSAIQGGEASVEGSFAWEDGSEMLSAGTHSKAVVFTPNDTDNYETQKVNVSLTVKKATPVITKIPTAEVVFYGTSLENITLENGVSSVEGTFDWKNDTTVPEVGTSSQMVVFTPTDSDNYNSVELKVSVTVKKLVPTISKKPSYGELTYGNTLQSLTLSSGVASTNGSFQWKEASQKPEAGISTEVVEFIPTDLAHYEMVEYETEVTTLKAEPVISVLPEAAAITYGECISGSAIQGGETSVKGTFAWENNKEMLSAGSYNKTAIFTPNDTKNYNSKKVKISITVNKATPDITKIPTTETKTYGVSLQDIALQDGISNVEGQFRWKEINTVPDVETRSYKAVFTPTDTDNYNVVEIDVPVTIVKATPNISNAPTFGNLIYGNTLGSLTLTGGYASVFGSFAWKEPNKTPMTGRSNELITFTPNDAKHHESVEFEVSVNTVKATPEIQTMPTASNITYGDAVASSVISGGAISTEGTFSWENEEDILNAGTYTRTAIFTPKDTKNYKTITAQLSLVVEKKTPDITTYPEVGETTYGKALNQLNMSEGVASVAGTFRWKNGTLVPEVGTCQCTMEFIPDDTNNYKTISFDIPVVITKATPIVNAHPVSSKITYTQQLGESRLTGGTASVPGEFCWVSGEIQPKAGTRNYEVAFVPTDEKNYNQVTFSVLVTIDPAATSITSTPTATDIIYGQKMQESNLFGGVGSVPGRFEWLDGDDVLNAGSYLRPVRFIPEDDKNYKESYCNVAFIIKKATPTIETTPVPSVITYGESLSTSKLTNGEADVEGEFTWRDGSTCPLAGESSQAVIFTPTDSYNYNRAIFNVTVTTKPKDVSELDISCDLSDKTYTETAITPEVIVKDGLKVCKQNTDYEIVYQNNTKIGTADIDIVGIGNYTGSVKKQFQIIAKDMSDKVLVPDITTTYNGEKHYIQPNIPSGAIITFGMSSALYNTKETPYFTNAGDYTVYWKVEQEYYKTVYGETHVIINPKKITDVVFPNATDITYGNTLGTSTLSNGSLTGKFTWKDPDIKPIVKNDGYEVVFTANDTDNYDYSSISDFNDEKHTIIRKVSLKVNPAEGKVPVFSVTGIMEGEELSLSSIYSTDNTLGTFYWNTPEMSVSLSNTAQDIMFIPNDMVNYDWSNITGWDEENKYAKFKYAVPVIAKPTATTIVEGQTLANSKLTSSQELTTYSWEDESIVPKAGTHSYKVNCVLGNTTVTRDIPVVVLKNDLKVSVADMTFNYDGTSHKLTATADDGVTIMYGTEDGKYPYAECPSYQEVGSYKIFWKAEKDGYTSVTGMSTLTIETARDAETTDQTAQNTVVLGKTPLKTKLVNKKQYITVSYARNTLASGYDIQYSLKKNFKKSYKLSVASNKIKVTKKAATRKKTQGPIYVSKTKNAQITTSIGMKYLTKKLKTRKGKYMYVRVRCYRTENGKKIYNNWSKVMKAKTF